MLDNLGNPTSNVGPTLTVNVVYYYEPCYGGAYYANIPITIPFGASTGTYTYAASTIVDCGQSNCVPEAQTIQCVSTITGQVGITLNGSSPITAC